MRAVKDYLYRGDVYQVNLSQRFEATIAGDPWQLYLRLRRVNPAPFAAYLSYPDVVVLSASPEEFLRLEAGVVSTRPMKGTRPRGESREADRRLAASLGLPLQVAPFDVESFFSADEAFLSNTVVGLMPLTELEGRPLGSPQPTSRWSGFALDSRQGMKRATIVCLPQA